MSLWDSFQFLVFSFQTEQLELKTEN